jgi:2-succinyl-6-hydroxy-2,4-cyclohexadiene-1-carboxylate synthase
MPRFSRTHRVVAIDLLGHGRTSTPDDSSRYSYDRAVADLAQFAERIGIDRASWLGYSLGGRLALGLALRFPQLVSQLILESAAPGIRDRDERLRRRRADELLAARIERDGVERFVAEWEALPLWHSQRTLSPAVRGSQHGIRTANQAAGLARSLRGMGQGRQPSLWHALTNLDMPVLLIVGALDRKYVAIAEEMHAKVRDSTLSVIPHAGHTVHLEQPIVFAVCVNEFTNRDRVRTRA